MFTISRVVVTAVKIEMTVLPCGRKLNVSVCLMSVQPDESSLDFSSCILRHGIKNAKELACGVCLLNVDARSKVRTQSYCQ